jgi:hypothetical protein
MGEMLDAPRDGGASARLLRRSSFTPRSAGCPRGDVRRAIEKKYRAGRHTVVRALASAWPGPRKQLSPRAPKLDPFKPAIDEILKADLDAPRKQRDTITRIYRRLADEHGMAGVTYPVVRAYVAERRPQVRADAGRGPDGRNEPSGTFLSDAAAQEA